MSVVLYGGGFNPPHVGHVSAAESAYAFFRPERFLVVPDGYPPHKPLAEGTPDGKTRLRLCRLGFASCPWAEVSDLSLGREGPSYMFDTVTLLCQQYPDQELILLLGADMLLCFEQWYQAKALMKDCTLAALCREDGENTALEQTAHRLRVRYGARVVLLPHRALPCSSTQIRSLLPQRQGSEPLEDRVYGEIIRHRLYGALPELSWLREKVYAMLPPKRIPHVAGCEQEARKLAERWAEDPDTAAEAGILHDMTKRWTAEEQLRACAEYGLELDEDERKSPQLLHARTGAAAAKELFGATEEICQAIRWHTTGKPDMNLLEKILYLADMIEPNRDYPGVDRLRKLAYEDLDAAMAEGLRQSVDSIRLRGMLLYKDTLAAYEWYAAAQKNKGGKTDVNSR